MKRYYYRLQASIDLEDPTVFETFIYVLNKLKPKSLKFEYNVDEIRMNVRGYSQHEIMWLLTDVNTEIIKVDLNDLVRETYLTSWELADVADIKPIPKTQARPTYLIE
jgi:hypothetical protein